MKPRETGPFSPALGAPPGHLREPATCARRPGSDPGPRAVRPGPAVQPHLTGHPGLTAGISATPTGLEGCSPATPRSPTRGSPTPGAHTPQPPTQGPNPQQRQHRFPKSLTSDAPAPEPRDPIAAPRLTAPPAPGQHNASSPWASVQPPRIRGIGTRCSREGVRAHSPLTRRRRTKKRGATCKRRWPWERACTYPRRRHLRTTFPRRPGGPAS